MNILRVGDPHIKVNNLIEGNALFGFVLAEAIRLKVDRIEILGDLFHTHNVIRLEVLEFWTEWLQKLSDQFQVVVLVGNHDKSGDCSSDFSALSLFSLIGRKNLIIVDKPSILGVFGYMPYIHDHEQFIKAVNVLSQEGARVIVCHQTFSGSKFENGMYAPEGLALSLLPEAIDLFISGHIHAEQDFGKCHYPGTARWDSQSDANRRKGIWFYTHREVNGAIESREFISTANICTPIIVLDWKEGEKPPVIVENAKVSIRLIGSSVWVAQQRSDLRGKCALSSTITDSTNTIARKSGKSLFEFMTDHYTGSIDRDKLLNYMKGLALV